MHRAAAGQSALEVACWGSAGWESSLGGQPRVPRVARVPRRASQGVLLQPRLSSGAAQSGRTASGPEPIHFQDTRSESAPLWLCSSPVFMKSLLTSRPFLSLLLLQRPIALPWWCGRWAGSARDYLSSFRLSTVQMKIRGWQGTPCELMAAKTRVLQYGSTPYLSFHSHGWPNKAVGQRTDISKVHTHIQPQPNPLVTVGFETQSETPASPSTVAHLIPSFRRLGAGLFVARGWQSKSRDPSPTHWDLVSGTRNALCPYGGMYSTYIQPQLLETSATPP